MIVNSQKRFFGVGAKVSSFTLGTMRVANNPEKMYEIIKCAHFAGINHLETAQTYGKAEYLIGKTLEKLQNKNNISKTNWIITTKVLPKGDFNYQKKNFYHSLSNLNLKKINNLAIHGINLNEHLDWVLNGEGKQFIDWAKEMGFVDQIGFSSHGGFQLIDNAIETNLFDFCNLHIHLLDKSKLSLAKKALKKNMGVLAISPADKGGKLYLPSQILLEASKPYHPLEIAYRFLFSEGITTLSLGANKPEDFDLAIKLANATHKLTKEELKVLNNIEDISSTRLGDTKCEQCRACLPCPNDVPIPEILRLRNIYIGNGQTEFAKERYNLIGRAGHWWELKNANYCDNCNICISKCPHDLDIPDLLKETHELLIERPRKRLWS